MTAMQNADAAIARSDKNLMLDVVAMLVFDSDCIRSAKRPTRLICERRWCRAFVNENAPCMGY
jgi:hypothetical protein